MKSFFPILLLSTVSILVTISSCNEPSDFAYEPELSPDAYELVWSDEFDGDEIDETKWSFEIGNGCDISPDLCGWGNNELQYYTDRPENVSVSNGRLIIKAVKETPLYLGEHAYTSARMITKGKGDWTYGRFDISARLPKGQGLWPAIWMLPTDTTYGIWPKSGEIDIMEIIGSRPNELLGTIHYGHNGHRFTSQYYTLEGETFADDFHEFSAIWTEDYIQFLLDGEPYGDPVSRSTTMPTTWPFDHPFHMILNIAIGGNLPGNPDASTVFPQVMLVDYVRVYQLK